MGSLPCMTIFWTAKTSIDAKVVFSAMEFMVMIIHNIMLGFVVAHEINVSTAMTKIFPLSYGRVFMLMVIQLWLSQSDRKMKTNYLQHLKPHILS